MSVYFAPEPADDARRIGLRGYWMGYFAGRLAPLGTVPAQAATAVLYVFASRWSSGPSRASGSTPTRAT